MPSRASTMEPDLRRGPAFSCRKARFAGFQSRDLSLAQIPGSRIAFAGGCVRVLSGVCKTSLSPLAMAGLGLPSPVWLRERGSRVRGRPHGRSCCLVRPRRVSLVRRSGRSPLTVRRFGHPALRQGLAATSWPLTLPRRLGSRCLLKGGWEIPRGCAFNLRARFRCCCRRRLSSGFSSPDQ